MIREAYRHDSTPYLESGPLGANETFFAFHSVFKEPSGGLILPAQSSIHRTFCVKASNRGLLPKQTFWSEIELIVLYDFVHALKKREARTFVRALFGLCSGQNFKISDAPKSGHTDDVHGPAQFQKLSCRCAVMDPRTKDIESMKCELEDAT